MRLCFLILFSLSACSEHTQTVLKSQRTLYFFVYIVPPVNVLSSFMFLCLVSFIMYLFCLLHVETQCLQFGKGMTKVLKY